MVQPSNDSKTLRNINKIKIYIGSLELLTVLVIFLALIFVLFTWPWLSSASIALIFVSAFFVLWLLGVFIRRYREKILLQGSYIEAKNQTPLTVKPYDRELPLQIEDPEANQHTTSTSTIGAESQHLPSVEQQLVMPRFYHIYLLEGGADGTEDRIKKKMDLAIDWLKYETNCWVVESDSSLDEWQMRLRSLVEPDGFLFICNLDISKSQGWMPKVFWEWINKKRTNPSRISPSM